MVNSLFAMAATVAVALVPFPARADIDNWHNVYHSLRNFSHRVENQFTSEHNHSDSSERKGRHHHSSSRKSRSHRETQDEDSQKGGGNASNARSPSAKPKTTSTPEPT